MSISFQITEDQGLYYFHLVDKLGGVLLISGEYDDKEDLNKAIQDVKVGTLVSQQIAAGKVANGNTFFVIKDRTGNIIAKSQLFDSQTNFDKALHVVKDNTCIAEVIDKTKATVN